MTISHSVKTILMIVVSSSPVFSMILEREKKVEDPKKHQQTVAEKTEEPRSIEETREGGKSAIEAEDDKPLPIKIPPDFSEIDKELLKQNLKKISPEKFEQYNSGVFLADKHLQDIFNHWIAKGVTIDPPFVMEANAIRKNAQLVTSKAKELEEKGEQVFEEFKESGRKQNYGSTIYHCNQLIKVADQAKNEWIKTA